MQMKKRNILVFILSLILIVAAVSSLVSCDGSFASFGKRTAADHAEFRRAVKRQGYINWDIYEIMVEYIDMN